MKIAVSSDLHIDLNHGQIDKLIPQQAKYLTEQGIDYCFFLGDTFNDFAKTRAYFTRLQEQANRTKIRYLAGNHDMLKNVSYAELESFTNDLYFHNQYIDLPQNNWRIIGNNGWYDYSFSLYEDQPEEVSRWKNAYWVDRLINQSMDDQERMRVVSGQVKRQLDYAQTEQKRVIFMTHFSPIKAALPNLHFVNSRRERMWEMTMAMMGSSHLGALLAQYPGVKAVFYGHLHYARQLITVNNIEYHNQAVGVRRERNAHWQEETLLNRWINRLYICKI